MCRLLRKDCIGARLAALHDTTPRSSACHTPSTPSGCTASSRRRRSVYQAFTTAAALAKWLPPHGYICEVPEFDARVGGRYRMAFVNLSTGGRSGFGGEFLDLEPGRLVRHTDRFDDPQLPGEMITTITLREVFCGTEMDVTQEGVPAVIPAEACHLGWQESLQLLTLLVEASVPG